MTSSTCDTWFDKASKKRKRSLEDSSLSQHVTAVAGDPIQSQSNDSLGHLSISNAAQWSEQEDDKEHETATFKRIRLEEESQLANSMLQCPFNFLRCTRKYDIENLNGWIHHSLVHFSTKGPPRRSASPPTTCHCCLCEMISRTSEVMQCWLERMEHVAQHHHARHSLSQVRPDVGLSDTFGSSVSSMIFNSARRSEHENISPV